MVFTASLIDEYIAREQQHDSQQQQRHRWFSDPSEKNKNRENKKASEWQYQQEFWERKEANERKKGGNKDW